MTTWRSHERHTQAPQLSGSGSGGQQVLPWCSPPVRAGTTRAAATTPPRTSTAPRSSSTAISRARRSASTPRSWSPSRSSRPTPTSRSRSARARRSSTRARGSSRHSCPSACRPATRRTSRTSRSPASSPRSSRTTPTRSSPAPQAVIDNANEYYTEGWVDYGTVDGTLYATPLGANVKSFVWYSPAGVRGERLRDPHHVGRPHRPHGPDQGRLPGRQAVVRGHRVR